MPAVEPLIRLRGASKRYPVAGGEFTALDGVDLEIGRGEFVAIAGPSGSGKSTLLALLAGIEPASDGEVFVDGRPLHRLSQRELSAWRGRGVGVVFQFFQLMPTLTAAENVMLPMDFCRNGTPADRVRRAAQLLDRLGIGDQAAKFPQALSGGQQQRVAVARALANAPPLLLADEPTGNLDSASGRALLEQVARLVREQQVTVVMVTHERDALSQVDRVVRIADGRIVDEPAHA